MSKTMAEVIESHLMADEDSCDCNEMFYDTRMSLAAIRHEHSLHVEMELHNAGFGPVNAAQAEALNQAADDYRHYEQPNARLYLRARAAAVEGDA